MNTIIETYVFNIEEELNSIEPIFNKYLEIPDNLLFIPIKRYPITDRKELCNYKQDFIKSEPLHPYMCADTVATILISYLTDLNPSRDLLKSNPLLKNSINLYSKYYSSSWTYDIIKDRIPGISEKDLDYVINIINKKVLKKADLISNINNIYKVINIDIESIPFTISFGEDVRAIRFEELRIQQEIEKNDNEGKEENYGVRE